MKGNELKLKEMESSHTLGGAGKVVSKGEGSGESVHTTLVSNTVTHSRTFSLADSTRGWGWL
jgi:hypothetical protein